MCVCIYMYIKLENQEENYKGDPRELRTTFQNKNFVPQDRIYSDRA